MGPPFPPASPSPVTRSLEPVSTPGGIFTSIFRLLWTLPEPWQVLHGESIMVPVPRHVPHVEVVMNLPKGVFWVLFTWPLPWHVEHFFGDVPGFAPLP